MDSDYWALSLAAIVKDLYESTPPVLNIAEPVTVNYAEYIKSPEWRKKAAEAKARADYRCQICYSTEHIQAHHRTYIRLGHELPTDITVLCDKCHTLFSKDHKTKPGAMPEMPF